jgi:uncharacterized protein
MSRSKTFLVDANVWLALATERHEHHTAARKWFTSLGEEEAAFCRITQMTLLRLLTSPAVMAEEVVKPREAWELYRKLRRDWRVTFSAEPAGLEGLWVDLMSSPNDGHLVDRCLSRRVRSRSVLRVSHFRPRFQKVDAACPVPPRQVSTEHAARFFGKDSWCFFVSLSLCGI